MGALKISPPLGQRVNRKQPVRPNLFLGKF